MTEGDESPSFADRILSVIQPSADASKLLLRNLFVRSGLTFDIREFDTDPPTRHRLSPPLAATHPQIVIAAISSNIILESGSEATPDVTVEASTSPSDYDFILREHRDDCRLCEPADGFDRSSWVAARVLELDHALRPPEGFAKPHIVCFGELSYPPPTSSAFPSSVEYMNQYGREQYQFEQRIRETFDARGGHDIFLFLGSYHCPLTLYNVGRVMPRGVRLGRLDVRVISRRVHKDRIEPATGRDTVDIPIVHRKRFPAKRASEQTRVPPDNQFQIFVTPVGRVAVLICSDVVDMNQFLFISRYNDSAGKLDRIDYVLVPSWNTSRSLSEMCRELSLVAATTVLVVNANSADDAFPDTAIYCCGLEVNSQDGRRSDDDDVTGAPSSRADFINVEIRDVHHPQGRTSTVTWFSFNTETLQNLVNQTADNVKAELGLATNVKDAPVFDRGDTSELGVLAKLSRWAADARRNSTSDD